MRVGVLTCISFSLFVYQGMYRYSVLDTLAFCLDFTWRGDIDIVDIQDSSAVSHPYVAGSFPASGCE